jgi:hypothetical protein
VKAGKHARVRQVDIDKGVSYFAAGGWLKYGSRPAVTSYNLPRGFFWLRAPCSLHSPLARCVVLVYHVLHGRYSQGDNLA